MRERDSVYVHVCACVCTRVCACTRPSLNLTLRPLTVAHLIHPGPSAQYLVLTHLHTGATVSLSTPPLQGRQHPLTHTHLFFPYICFLSLIRLLAPSPPKPPFSLALAPSPSLAPRPPPLLSRPRSLPGPCGHRADNDFQCVRRLAVAACGAAGLPCHGSL